MQIIIVRHGKAEGDSPTGRDEDRRLKGRGERQARWLGEQFKSRPPARIVSSGHVRAIATARLIQAATGSELMVEPRLELGHQPSHSVEVIRDHADHDPLMLVGHNPQLAQLVWVLARGTPAHEADLRTGEAVVLEFDPDTAPGEAAVIERLRLED